MCCDRNQIKNSNRRILQAPEGLKFTNPRIGIHPIRIFLALPMGLDYARLVCDINLQTTRSSACAIMDTPLEDSQIAPRQALHPRELPMLFRGIAKCLSVKHLRRRLVSYIEISILHSLVCLHLT